LDSRAANPHQTRSVDRIVHKADFERVLGARLRSRSAHFALHHLHEAPLPRRWQPKTPIDTELSTAPAPICPQPVDDLPTALWLGCVVPKRHARRAVTRNLIKRQIRSAFDRLGAGLPGGLWLVRLRSPFLKTEFISARSPALAAATRAELEQLLSQAGGRPGLGKQPRPRA
jgi:ribonuclease P protein component